MSEKLYTEGALRAEPVKLVPCLQPQVDSLDMHLKEINSFNISIQNIKDFKIFIIMKLKNNLKHIKL